MTRGTSRSLALLALVVPATLGLVGLQPTAALAAGSITSPSSDGQVYRSGSTITASATVRPLSSAATLTLTDPAGAKATRTSTAYAAGSQTLTIAVATGDGATVRNGSWLVQRSGGASGTRRFTTSFPPATPSGFSAQGSGSRQVSFAWTRGSEPDLTGWTLLDGSGAVVQDGLTPDTSCSGSTCTTGLAYPADAPGPHYYALVAHRPDGSGTGSLDSGRATATATLDDPPAPPPAAGDGSSGGSGGSAGSASGGSGGSTGSGSAAGGPTGSTGTPPNGTTGATGPGTGAGSTTGAGTTGSIVVPPLTPAQQRSGLATGSTAFAPSLGIPTLPPLPTGASPVVAGPLPQGSYLPTLPYKPVTRTEATGTTATLTTLRTAVTRAVDPRHVATSLAGALLLLLVAAHVRRFVRTPAGEPG